MKSLCTLWMLMSLLSNNLTVAQKKKSTSDSVTIVIHLNNISNNQTEVDSAFIVFDKHDLSGAGIIKQVFYPIKNQIAIENVPRGKYYVDIICLGFYNQTFYRKAKFCRKKNTMVVRLKYAEEYIPGVAIIPKESVDFGKLSVTSMK